MKTEFESHDVETVSEIYQSLQNLLGRMITVRPTTDAFLEEEIIVDLTR